MYEHSFKHWTGDLKEAADYVPYRLADSFYSSLINSLDALEYDWILFKTI